MRFHCWKPSWNTWNPFPPASTTSASTPAEQDEEAIHIDPEKIKQEVEDLREELEKKKQEAEAMLDLMKGIGALP